MYYEYWAHYYIYYDYIIIIDYDYIIIHNHYNCCDYHHSIVEISFSVIFYSPGNGWNRERGTKR
jgi:hypothetical protein